MSAPIESVSPDVDLNVVGQIISAIGALYIYPTEADFVEFLVPLLKGIPGCQSASLCFRKIAHPIGELRGNHCLCCSKNLDRRVESGPYSCGLVEPGKVRAYPLETNGGFYGYFVLRVAGESDYEKYESFIRNLGNALAVLLENRRQFALKRTS